MHRSTTPRTTHGPKVPGAQPIPPSKATPRPRPETRPHHPVERGGTHPKATWPGQAYEAEWRPGPRP
eukprot:9307119-Alexandrium_andersonii.AAC.1